MCQNDPENDFVCGIPIMNPIDSRLQELRTASEVIVRGTGHQPCITSECFGILGTGDLRWPPPKPDIHPAAGVANTRMIAAASCSAK